MKTPHGGKSQGVKQNTESGSNVSQSGQGVKIDLNQVPGQGFARPAFDLGGFINEAVQVLRGHGLDVDAGSLDKSGGLARCALIDKAKGTDGAYIVHLDFPPSVWWENFPAGDSGTWKPAGVNYATMTDQERQAEQERIKKDRAAKEEARRMKYAEAAEKARRAYERAKDQDVALHPYAARKGLKNCPLVRRGEYMGHDCLIVPLYDKDGQLVTVQAIGPDKVFGKQDRDKTLMAGGQKGIHPIGPTFRGAPVVVIVEGLTTGDAIVTATGLPVVMAVDKGGLLPTARIVRELAAPGASIILAADDDQPDPDGIAKAVEAAREVGGGVALPAMGKKADFWDVLNELGPEAVKERIEAAAENIQAGPCAEALAKGLFPRVSFPWHVMPSCIEESFKQLARACATSATPLPGVAFCLVASAVGRKFSVSAKQSWTEPVLFWFADIRQSGEGKTAPMWKLAGTVTELQREEHEAKKKELAEWGALSPKERQGQTPPVPPRGYFTTNLTLEGLHAELSDHPTGGMVALMSELSAILNGQGEYKAGKGTDRESWLCLHDGNPARVVRAGKSAMIHGARVQVCGGIQPGIFGKLFAGQDGTFLVDGTIFRFLTTFEPPTYFELTPESWSSENADAWAAVLKNAFRWARESEGITAMLSSEAQARFFTWRNSVEERKPDVPPMLRGFLPKSYGHALRLAGVLHLLHRFSQGREPGRVLHMEDIERGIVTVEFYLGQALDALALVACPGQAGEPVEVTPRSIILARTLDGLRSDTENGRLAVSFILERFNELAPPEERITSPRVFAGMLRACGLDTAPGVHDFKGARRVTCLQWSEKIDSFIKNALHSLHPLQSQERQGLANGEKGICFSPFSPSGGGANVGAERTERRENASLHRETYGPPCFGENGENGEENHAGVRREAGGCPEEVEAVSEVLA